MSSRIIDALIPYKKIEAHWFCRNERKQELWLIECKQNLKAKTYKKLNCVFPHLTFDELYLSKLKERLNEFFLLLCYYL